MNERREDSTSLHILILLINITWVYQQVRARKSVDKKLSLSILSKNANGCSQLSLAADKMKGRKYIVFFFQFPA
jgi:hypothetical protein